jgi:hypothetical protein
MYGAWLLFFVSARTNKDILIVCSCGVRDVACVDRLQRGVPAEVSSCTSACRCVLWWLEFIGRHSRCTPLMPVPESHTRSDTVLSTRSSTSCCRMLVSKLMFPTTLPIWATMLEILLRPEDPPCSDATPSCEGGCNEKSSSRSLTVTSSHSSGISGSAGDQDAGSDVGAEWGVVLAHLPAQRGLTDTHPAYCT